GMGIDRILQQDLLRSERVVNPITVHGVQYPNMASAVRSLDPPASSATLTRWISRGMSPEKAFEEVPNPGYANGVLYLVRHLASGKCYVGLTICTIEERWSRHIEQAYLAKIKAHHSLHAAVRKFGPDAFTIEKVGSGTTKAGLEAAERRKIAELNTLAPHGFNISPGGGSGGAAGVPVKVDGVTFASKRAAAEHLVATRQISLHAAKARLRYGRLDPKPAAKPGESLVKTRAYKTWSYIVYCATNPINRDYLLGISASPRWKADFKHFLADMGQPELGQVFSRKDKSKGFTKANCEWRTVNRPGLDRHL
ncbi:MAG: GIY-YIG nuclease family protein, partial [Hydrogenophaga sp.]|nr:GIY-YIG nuclease family protein [Hydrogenophaga sp.]